MSGLAIKDVRFNGTTLRAAQDAENIIWVGVRWVCEGMGLSENRTDYERKRIQNDLVLSKGVKFYSLGNDRAKSDVLCLKLDFLPLFKHPTCIRHGKIPCIRKWIASALTQRNLASALMLCVGFIST